MYFDYNGIPIKKLNPKEKPEYSAELNFGLKEINDDDPEMIKYRDEHIIH